MRFGTAILAGGLVAVIAQQIALGHDRKLRREDADRVNVRLRRALVSEIDENLLALESRGFRIQLTRSAWENARSIEFSEEVFVALAGAYRLAQSFNANNAAISEKFARSTTGMIPIGSVAPGDPEPVREAFQKARLLLVASRSTHSA